jgi:acetoin utilization deacetylase AcuC-like enzyme
MDKLAIVYNEKHYLHKPPFQHAETPQRIEAVYDYLKAVNFLSDMDLYLPEPAGKEDILTVHSEKHYNYILESIKNGKSILDEGDTYAVKDSFNVALLSAGCGLKAIELLMKNDYKNVFCLTRPPGHHAERNYPMGFCFFNNIAITAQTLIDKYKFERIAIIDFDVHHGNGTQNIFYESNKVLFISLHQFPFYPGSGAENEIGKGEGEGFTLNFPLPAGTNGDVYQRIFEGTITERLGIFNPQIILISAGFDAHKDDPLANMNLTEHDFYNITKALKDFSAKNNLPIISILEGGYNLSALPLSVYQHLNALIA